MRSLPPSFVCAFILVSCSGSSIPAENPSEPAVPSTEGETERDAMTFAEPEPTNQRGEANQETIADALDGESDPQVLEGPNDTGRGGGGTGEGTMGLGNVGLIGKGGGGGPGSGYGRRSGSTVPRVRQAKATVEGPLDKDIIRRIVRAHINEVRDCYNDLLAVDPAAQGRVAIDFTIGPSGKVERSAVADDSVKDPAMATCLAAAVKRWKFPKPQNGGQVKVLYPFSFLPGGGLATADEQWVLNQLSTLDVTTWTYTADEQQARHLGPMAIKALHERLKQLDDENQALRSQLAELEKRFEKVER